MSTGVIVYDVQVHAKAETKIVSLKSVAIFISSYLISVNGISILINQLSSEQVLYSYKM
jgi:hypothetical protein